MIESLAKKLRQRREMFKLTQKQAAQRLGVSVSLISGYETGERTPSLILLRKLSSLYRCSTDYLLGNEPATSRITIDITDLPDECRSATLLLIESIINAKKEEKD